LLFFGFFRVICCAVVSRIVFYSPDFQKQKAALSVLLFHGVKNWRF
jgi:hypothetical protein